MKLMINILINKLFIRVLIIFIFILGSNQLSFIGNQLYTYTNTSYLQSEIKIVIPSYSDDFPQLCLYGMIPYRYISVRSISGSVLISELSFSFNNCDKDEH